jgi:hypothetical protein
LTSRTKAWRKNSACGFVALHESGVHLLPEPSKLDKFPAS